MTSKEQSGANCTRGSALVLGGSGGLGAAICCALVRDWSHVVVGYHTQTRRAAEVVAGAQALGARALAVKVDIGSVSSIKQCVAAAEEFGGTLGALIYAVGLRKHFDFVSRTALEDWEQALKTDILGLLSVFRVAVPALCRARGSLIAMSTYQGGRIEIQGALSSVPKAAVDRLIAAIAKEEGKFGIRANALRIGWIDAGSGGSLLSDEGARARKLAEIPLRRFGMAADVGEAVAFLASPRAAFITGAVLSVDGGESL